jgi:sialic acid synthase SpsE
VPAFKIASGDNDFFPLLSAVARTGKPVLLSTGMLDLAGVARAQAHLEAEWIRSGVAGELTLLHCVVAYPTPDEQANLGAILDLARLGATVGYSDHTLGIDAAVLSVALGARVVEKHFTLDRNASDFRDHKLSADPADFREMVRRIRLAEAMLGLGVKRPMPVEEANMTTARRAIVAACDLEAGAVIAEADLSWVRPRSGLEPGREADLLGRRLTVPVMAGTPVLPEHLARS